MPHLLLHFVIWILAVYAIAALALAFLAVESVEGYEDERGFHATSQEPALGRRETAVVIVASGQESN